MSDSSSSNEVAELRSELESVWKLSERQEKEIERLTYQHEKLHEIHAALEREAVRLTAELAIADRGITNLGKRNARLRAALEDIIYHDSVDNEGDPMPETGAAFIAKQALAGHAETVPNADKVSFSRPDDETSE